MGCVSGKQYIVKDSNNSSNLPVPKNEDSSTSANLFENTLCGTVSENQLKDGDLRSARRICVELEKCLKKFTSNDTKVKLNVKLIGSYSNGVGERNADVSIAVSSAEDGEKNYLEEIADFLRKFCVDDDIKMKLTFSFTNYIATSVIPIIQMRHISTNSGVLISWNRPENSRTDFLIKKYAEIHPLMTPLYVLIRKWVKMQNLSNVFDDNIGAFQLAILLIFHLQKNSSMPVIPICQSPTEKDISKAAETIPRMKIAVKEEVLKNQLINFCDFYYKFDTFLVIDIRNDQEITKLNLPDNEKWWTPLAMVHPVTGENGTNQAMNISLTHFHELRTALGVTLDALR